MMPWIHFHVGNKGVVKACCVANIPYGDINKQSLDEIWHGTEINLLRDKFINGHKDNRCHVCHNIEAGGGTSIRQETLQKYAGQPTDLSITQSPIYFDIRFSNICNFRCRTCWHGASSKWFKDAQSMKTNVGQSAIIKNINDYANFINKLGPSLISAQEIYFAGGEPLVTEEHYLLLNFLIENNATKIRLRYNTNFSTLSFGNYHVIELWKKFEYVEVLASIDATDKLGEYVRKEFNWNLFLTNKKEIDNLQNVSFKISPTISVFNIGSLPDLYQKSLDMGLIDREDLYINILERPYHYNVQCLPYEYKCKIKKKLVLFVNHMMVNQFPPSIINSFNECISFMMAKDLSRYWPTFLKETATLDRLRDERLDSVLDFEA